MNAKSLNVLLPMALAMMMCIVSCSSETRVRISGARPGEEDYTKQRAPYSAVFCLPTSYSDGNFTWARDAGAVAIKFLYPSLAPGGRDRFAQGFVRLSVWPGPEDGRRFDYSREVFPTHGDPVPHPHMNPPSMAIQRLGISRHPLPPVVFPSFASDTYMVIPNDEAWRERVRIECSHSPTADFDWCTTTFQTSRGFVVHMGSNAETTYDLPSLMASADSLIERFLAACDVRSAR